MRVNSIFWFTQTKRRRRASSDSACFYCEFRAYKNSYICEGIHLDFQIERKWCVSGFAHHWLWQGRIHHVVECNERARPTLQLAMLSSKLLASDLITNQYYQHLLKRLEDIMSSAALQLYRLLHRSARMYIPTKVGRQFAQERIRSEFRAHQFEQDPIIINALLHRAYSALMSSLDETAKKRLEKGVWATDHILPVQSNLFYWNIIWICRYSAANLLSKHTLRWRADLIMPWFAP